MSSQIAPRNPFRPGMGLEPPYLADRNKHLERFARFLEGFPDLPRNVRLTGLRGVGKTVLLQHYSNAAGERDWLVVRREWSEHLQDERMLALALVEDCRQAAETIARSKRMRHAVSVAQETLDLLGSLTVSLAGIGITVALRSPSERLRQQVTLEDQLFGALKMTVEAALTAGRRGLVLCYDEAHVVRDSPRMRQFPLGTLLAVVAKAQREPLPLMLVLSGLPTLTENLALAKSYSERMFQAEELERLRPPEDMNAFCRPLAVAERSFEPTMGEMVIRDTSGYPFFVQLFGAALWDGTAWPAAITTDDYQHQRPLVLEALDRAFFDARLARTAPFERRLLQAVARDGEVTSMREVVARLGISNGAAQRTILSLADKGLVFRPERGSIAFALPLFGEYLRRRFSRESS